VRKFLRYAAAAAILWAGVPSLAQAELTLQVTPVQDVRDVDFGQARSLGPQGEPEGSTVVRQVRLIVTSTSGRPYQIFQRVNEPWRSVAGEALPLESIRFYAARASTGGSIQVPNPTPLAVGEQELFLSDVAGSSDELLVTYAIQVPPGQRAGDYRTTMTYRVVSR